VSPNQGDAALRYRHIPGRYATTVVCSMSVGKD
jgi:hypothetical protein